MEYDSKFHEEKIEEHWKFLVEWTLELSGVDIDNEQYKYIFKSAWLHASKHEYDRVT